MIDGSTAISSTPPTTTRIATTTTTPRVVRPTHCVRVRVRAPSPPFPASPTPRGGRRTRPGRCGGEWGAFLFVFFGWWSLCPLVCVLGGIPTRKAFCFLSYWKMPQGGPLSSGSCFFCRFSSRFLHPAVRWPMHCELNFPVVVRCSVWRQGGKARPRGTRGRHNTRPRRANRGVSPASTRKPRPAIYLDGRAVLGGVPKRRPKGRCRAFEGPIDRPRA